MLPESNNTNSSGFFSFLSNAFFLYLIYNGVKTDNMYQVFFCSFVELSFYQYSIYGAMREVTHYNSRENFYQKVRLGISTDF